MSKSRRLTSTFFSILYKQIIMCKRPHNYYKKERSLANEKYDDYLKTIFLPSLPKSPFQRRISSSWLLWLLLPRLLQLLLLRLLRHFLPSIMHFDGVCFCRFRCRCLPGAPRLCSLIQPQPRVQNEYQPERKEIISKNRLLFKYRSLHF